MNISLAKCAGPCSCFALRLLLLLLACTNLATLFSHARRACAELAVRAAIGATRWRVVRQLLRNLCYWDHRGALARYSQVAVHLVVATLPLTVPP